MDFRLELHIKPFAKQIQLQDPIMLMGSCFTDHISKKLSAHKFSVCENPHGILFNPRSIENALQACVSNKRYTEKDLFLFNELYTSWEHHGQFSHPDAAAALHMMNASTNAAHQFLRQAKWMIITLGSAWVYELNNTNYGGNVHDVAANCHKVPQQHFNHRLLTASATNNSLQNIVNIIRSFNPGINIIFTISPVRHYREGLVENNRSKALLISAVHEIIGINPDIFYFPSYELVLDDLRDYRFFAEDMVHPNYQATQYVWEKFVPACIDASSRLYMDDIIKIVHAKNHKALHPASLKHKQFLNTMLERTKQLQQKLPGTDFSAEISYFSV